MPFCEYCGRPVRENEICNCRSGNVPPPRPQPMNPYAQPAYAAPQAQPQKQSLWWIWLIIVPVVLLILFMGGILAAIFVPAYIGYKEKSKVTSANSSATSVYKAVNTVLTEFDEEGVNIDGYFIVSSDGLNNWNVPFDDESLDDFYIRMNRYYENKGGKEWFAFVEKGICVYTASAESWSSKTVGTYPNRATVDGPGLYDTYTASRYKMSLSEVYNKSSDTFSHKENDESSYVYY